MWKEILFIFVGYDFSLYILKTKHGIKHQLQIRVAITCHLS